MIIKRHILHSFLCGTACIFLSGCIGEDPNEQTTPPSPTVPLNNNADNTVPTPIAPASTKLGEKQPLYTVRTSHNALLHHYFTHRYVTHNESLEKRDQHDSEDSVKNKLDALPKWKDESTRWTDQHGTETTYPPTSADARIANDKHASTLQADGHIILQNLDMDGNTGIYIPGDYDNSTTLLAQRKLMMGPGAWIDVRGRLEAGWLDMRHGSVIDLTNGFGLSVLQKQKTIDYDRQLTPTSVLKVEQSGRVDLDGATITAHKVDVRGTLTSHNSTLNLQTRRVRSGEPDVSDIQFSQQGPEPGKISILQAKDTDTPDHVLTINGPAHFYSGSEIRLFVGRGKVSTIDLKNPFISNKVEDKDKPTMEGKITISPTKGVTTLENTPEDSPLLMIKSSIGFQLSIKPDQLLTTKRLLRKKLDLQHNVIPEENAPPKYPQGLFLKISDDAKALSGGFTTITHPLQSTVQSALLANLKADTEQLQTSLRRSNQKTQIFSIKAQSSNSSSQAQNHAIGMGHKFEIGKTGMVANLKGLVHQISAYNPIFSGVPNGNAAINILNYSASIQREYCMNSIRIAPSIGASYALIPETVHQVAFQTLHPELSLSAHYTLHADSYKLSVAGLLKEILQTQELNISDYPFMTNLAFVAQL